MVGRKKLSSSILISCVFFLFPFCFLPTPTGSIPTGYNKYFRAGQPV